MKITVPSYIHSGIGLKLSLYPLYYALRSIKSAFLMPVFPKKKCHGRFLQHLQVNLRERLLPKLHEKSKYNFFLKKYWYSKTAPFGSPADSSYNI